MQTLGFIFLVIGILFLLRPVITMVIKFSNMLRGVQSKITSGTVLYYRIGAFIWIGFSLLLILGWLRP